MTESSTSAKQGPGESPKGDDAGHIQKREQKTTMGHLSALEGILLMQGLLAPPLQPALLSSRWDIHGHHSSVNSSALRSISPPKASKGLTFPCPLSSHSHALFVFPSKGISGELRKKEGDSFSMLWPGGECTRFSAESPAGFLVQGSTRKGACGVTRSFNTHSQCCRDVLCVHKAELQG